MNQKSDQKEVLKMTDVRKRQQSCTIQELLKDDLADFNINQTQQRRVTISEMMQMDMQDESLLRYKASLLGDLDESALKEVDEPPEVEFLKMEIVCKNRPKGNIILDLTGEGFKENQKHPFIIKEDEIYNLRIHFKVKNDCVFGLKFFNIIKRKFITVEKYDEMMGSFAPKKQVQVFDLTAERAPEGMFARGTYKGKVMFIDKDGIVHMQYEYHFEIGKDW